MKKISKFFIFTLSLLALASFIFALIKTQAKFPKETPEEAIQYAKTMPQVRTFLGRYSARGYKEHIWAKFEEDENVWIVVVTFHDVCDLGLVVHFDPDGKGIKIEESMGG